MKAARILFVCTLIEVACCGATNMHRDRSTVANSSKATITVSGDVSVVLVDPIGRRDVWADEQQVSAIPGCVRTVNNGDTDSEDQSPVRQVTVFELTGVRRGAYRVYAQVAHKGDIDIGVILMATGGKVCGANDTVVARTSKRWSWQIILRDAEDGTMCRVVLKRGRSISERKG
jgi:hypothetical protein